MSVCSCKTGDGEAIDTYLLRQIIILVCIILQIISAYLKYDTKSF